MKINIADEERMNLLGLLLKRMIEKNLNDTINLKKLNNKKIFIQAGKMKVTLNISDDNIEIKRVTAIAKSNAKIRGSFDAFIRIATGKRRPFIFFIEILSGNIRIGGNPLTLLPLIKVLK